MRTTAAVVRAVGEPLEIEETEEIELPPLEPKLVLVRIAGVDICHTDLSSQAGKLGARVPSTFDQEDAGVVAAIGADVRQVAPGDRVVLGPTSDVEPPSASAKNFTRKFSIGPRAA